MAVSKFDSRRLKTAEPLAGATHWNHTVRSGTDAWVGSPGSPVERAVLCEILPVTPVIVVGVAKLSLAGEFCAHCMVKAPVSELKPSTAIRYVVPAVALKVTFDWEVPLNSS